MCQQPRSLPTRGALPVRAVGYAPPRRINLGSRLKLTETHDVSDPPNFDGDILRLPVGFLCIFDENADAGARGGRKLGLLSEKATRPVSRYESLNKNESDARLKPGEFNALRNVANLALGFPVMPAVEMRGAKTVSPGRWAGRAGASSGFGSRRNLRRPVYRSTTSFTPRDAMGPPISRGRPREMDTRSILRCDRWGLGNICRAGTPLISRWPICIVKSQGLTLGGDLVNLCT